MIKGLLIYSSLLFFTILLATLIMPKDVRISDLSQRNKSINVGKNNDNSKIFSINNSHSVVKFSDDGVFSDAQVQKIPPSPSKKGLKEKKISNLLLLDDDVVDSDMRAQEVAYLTGTGISSKGDDYDVVTVEMVMSENSYSKNAIIQDETTNLSLFEDINSTEQIPVDLTIPNDVVTYQKMESERLYAEIKKLGKTQLNFEDP